MDKWTNIHPVVSFSSCCGARSQGTSIHMSIHMSRPMSIHMSIHMSMAHLYTAMSMATWGRLLVTALLPLCLLVLLFIFMSSMLGVEAFGSSLPPDYRPNFNSLLPSKHGYGASMMVFIIMTGLYSYAIYRYGAFMTVFIIMTGENWNEVMYICMNTVGDVSVLYFLGVIFIGAFTLLTQLG